MKKCQKTFWLLIALTLVFPFQSAFSEMDNDMDTAEQKPYRFEEQLDEAAGALLIKENGDRKEGIWHKGRFVYQGEYHSIATAQAVYEGRPRGVVSLEVSDQIKQRLQFLHVPAGAKLVLNFKIPDQGRAASSDASVYIRVWAGKKKLGRIRVMKQDGWKKWVADLGIIRFLKRETSITLDFTSDDAQGANIVFRGVMKI